jgi:hypothetical protein
VLNTSSIKGNGYGSFFVVAYNFLKFIQNLILPFFLGTIIMGDSHVTFSIDWMNPIANNLSIFCLTIVA